MLSNESVFAIQTTGKVPGVWQDRWCGAGVETYAAIKGQEPIDGALSGRNK
jgi:hypothetical protein